MAQLLINAALAPEAHAEAADDSVLHLAEVDEDFQRLLMDRASLEAGAAGTIKTCGPSALARGAAASTQAFGDYADDDLSDDEWEHQVVAELAAAGGA